MVWKYQRNNLPCFQDGSDQMSEPNPTIVAGQIWRDKDKRREQDGSVRKFVVVEVGEHSIQCRLTPNGKAFHFNRSRFGSGRANDSFELVTM